MTLKNCSGITDISILIHSEKLWVLECKAGIKLGEVLETVTDFKLIEEAAVGGFDDDEETIIESTNIHANSQFFKLADVFQAVFPSTTHREFLRYARIFKSEGIVKIEKRN